MGMYVMAVWKTAEMSWKMNDYNVKVSYKQADIVFENFEEIKAALAEQMEVYNSLEITEDGKQTAKKDVATLRKIKKAIEDRRKEIKQTVMEPYNGLEKQVKELTALIDQPINMITSKLDEYEQKRIEEKKLHIVDLWNEIIKIPGADMDLFYDQSWENATTTDASIKSDISALNVKYEAGLQVINSFEDVGEDELKKAVDIFVKNKLDSTPAIMEINHFREHKKMLEEQAAREAERKAEEERLKAERKAEEERLIAERNEAEEKAKAEKENEPESPVRADIENEYLDNLSAQFPDPVDIPDPADMPEPEPKNFVTINVSVTETERNDLISYLYANNIDFEEV